MTLPKELQDVHGADYRDGAYRELRIVDLGHAISFFLKRASRRLHPEKRDKDLRDAGNYMKILRSRVEEVTEEIRSVGTSLATTDRI